MTKASPFNGFTREAATFLGELAANNQRAWFAPHKALYEAAVQAPMRHLVAELASATMAAIRAHIEVAPDQCLDAMEQALRAGYSLEGDVYNRPRIPQNQPPLIQEWYRRKTAYVVKNRPSDMVFDNPALPEELKSAFAAAAPLYRFLTQSLMTDPER